MAARFLADAPENLDRLRTLFPPEEARARGTELVLLDATDLDLRESLLDLVDGEGYDDVVVFAASKAA